MVGRRHVSTPAKAARHPSKYQSSRSILHGLKATDEAHRQADQRSVTVVQPAEKCYLNSLKADIYVVDGIGGRAPPKKSGKLFSWQVSCKPRAFWLRNYLG